MEFSTDRGYKRGSSSQVNKVKRMTRPEVLSKSIQPRSTKTPFVVTYHSRLPDIGKILRELHPILESSERCKNAINSVPFVAFRKPLQITCNLLASLVTFVLMKKPHAAFCCSFKGHHL